MSKLSKCVKRFEEVRIGADIRHIDKTGKKSGEDVRPLVRIVGMKGQEATKLMDLADDDRTKEAMKLLVLAALQEDDSSTTEEEYNNMDMADVLMIANVRTKLSGLGEMFNFKKKQENQNSNQSFMNSFREKVRKGDI